MDEIDWAVYTYGFIDIDIASLEDDVMHAHSLALFQLVRNVSLYVGSSLHDIDIVGISGMASC